MSHISGPLQQLDEAVITSYNLQADALGAVAALENIYLFVQDPEGAGKIYTSNHIIVDLIKRDRKIGITSNSHKTIHNLRDKVESIVADKSVQFYGVKKASRGWSLSAHSAG